MVTVLLVGLLTTACTSTPTFDPNQPATGPLVALPDCEDSPVASAAGADGGTGDEQGPDGITLPDGIALPEGTVPSQAVPQGPITTVTGYVPVTPVNVRLGFEAREDLEAIIIEDEVFEAEVLVSDATHRTYVKATAICATGSTVTAMVAAELDAQGLPVPAGALDQ